MRSSWYRAACGRRIGMCECEYTSVPEDGRTCFLLFILLLHSSSSFFFFFVFLLPSSSCPVQAPGCNDLFDLFVDSGAIWIVYLLTSLLTFSRFCTAHLCAKHMQTQTHRPLRLRATYVAMSRIYVYFVLWILDCIACTQSKIHKTKYTKTQKTNPNTAHSLKITQNSKKKQT